MPFDQKRINGPEITVPYNIYTVVNDAVVSDKKPVNYFDKRREDGREKNDLRKICKSGKFC